MYLNSHDSCRFCVSQVVEMRCWSVWSGRDSCLEDARRECVPAAADGDTCIFVASE